MFGTPVDTHRPADKKVKGEKLQETGGQVGLKINIHKTNEMWIGVTQQESLELHGKLLKEYPRSGIWEASSVKLAELMRS